MMMGVFQRTFTRQEKRQQERAIARDQARDQDKTLKIGKYADVRTTNARATALKDHANVIKQLKRVADGQTPSRDWPDLQQ